MNKFVKTLVLSLFVISCIMYAPAYGKIKKLTEEEKPNYKPKNSQIWMYSDDTKAYEKEKNVLRNKRSNIHEVSYNYNEEADEEYSDILFTAPFGRYRKMYDPDAKHGINYIKRAARDFE